MTGFGKNDKNPTCIIGASDWEIDDSIPAYEGSNYLQNFE